MITNEELPVGFMMELARHSDILKQFSEMPKQKQDMIIEGARQMHSHGEMRSYVESMTSLS